MTIEKCMLIDIDYLMKCVKEDCRDNEGILIGQIEGEI